MQGLLKKTIVENEGWLVKRITRYAQRHEYTRYVPTRMEAWRIAIAGLSEALAQAIDEYGEVPELYVDSDYTNDPITAFGILEAERHRSRGVTLPMFLGLMKYYKQSYLDLVMEQNFDREYENTCKMFIERCFDRIEIGFCANWSQLGKDERVLELQESNRYMTGEKNKYQSIFDNFHEPVILVNNSNRIENLNKAAARLLEISEAPAGVYHNRSPEDLFPWLAKELKAAVDSEQMVTEFEKELDTREGKRCYRVRLNNLNKMTGVNTNPAGTAVLLHELTEKGKKRR